MLYKILIVDDEEEIRLGIIKKIDWENYGFTIVGDAQNGIEALEKAETLQPDIIMTDVRMPFMDGLELGSKILEIFPSTKIIIFSGCDDFEYAQKAIRINVIEYVLKPINSEELIEILKKLKITLDEENNEKQNVDLLQKHYIESLPILREQFLISLIEGNIIKEDIERQIKKLGIDLSLKYLSVAVANIDKVNLNNTAFKENRMLLSISAKKTIDSILGKACNFISFVYLDKVIIIGNFEEEKSIKFYINALNESCRALKKIVNCDMTIGVGRTCYELGNLDISYNDAKSALEYRVIVGSEQAIYIEDMEPNSAITLEFNDDLERTFINAIKIGSNDEIEKVVEELFYIDNKIILPMNEYRTYAMEIVMTLIKLMKSYNFNISSTLGDDFYKYVYFSNFTSINEIGQWFKEKCGKVNRDIKSQRITSSKVIVDKAVEYIEANYMDYDLSVDKVCAELHVSSAYFSTIFKKETNISFVNYLTEKRMEEAVKLLNTTDYKTSFIAEKVGYVEANYFSYVFKKKYGISPMRYRKR